MILSAIIIGLIISLIITITIPYIIIIYLRTLFTTVQMKLYSPFSLRGILINGPTSLWGLSHLTIFISAIQLGWSPNKLKLRLTLSNLHIYLSRRMFSLHSVNLINGNQEANIIYNFKHFLFDEMKSQQEGVKVNSSQISNKSRIGKKATASYFLEGMLHFFVIFFLRTFEVVLTDSKIFIVSGIPQEKMCFKTAQSKKSSLMLMQFLSQYHLKCDKISVFQEIQHHNKYNLVFKTEQILVKSYTHYEKHFILLEDVQMDLIIPFSMSLKQSFQRTQIAFRITNAKINLTVSDFQHFFEFIKQMIFEVHRKKLQQEQENQKQLCIFAGKIKIELLQLFQSQFDNIQAKQYLQHLCKAILELQQFSLSQRNFSIKNSSLSITKYSKHSLEQRQIKVLNLPNFQIINKYPEEAVQIRHEDVTVSCHSQQVAFFGKIFSLINERIRFQNYNQQIYKDLKESYNPNGTLISQIQRMIMSYHIKLDESFENDRHHGSKKLIYVPKKLIILLKMKKLGHIIIIDGFNYTRSRNLNEMSHQISVNKLTVQHKNFKQFSVSNFQLTFSQTIIEKHLTMRISEIIMQQNVQTLIDYLDSFTLFKHLLQFESDQMIRSKKTLKKYICIDLVAIHFQNQVVNIYELKIDKNSNRNQLMDNLYFSIERCELILRKFGQKSHVNQILSHNHTLFWIDSLSIKTTFEERCNKIKPKTSIIVNGPSLNLPQTNVSTILLSYIKVYANLQSHIEAFLINVTGQKLKSLKYHMKQFFIQPDQLNIIVTNLCLSISDTKFDKNIIAFSKTVREYLLINPRYNQAEIISILRRNNKANHPLLHLKLQKITLQVTPIQILQPNFTSVQEWIDIFQTLNSQIKKNDKSERLRKVKSQQFWLKIKGISVKIRDYPSPILTITQIKIQGERLQAKKIFGARQNYLKGSTMLGQFFVSLGLGQLSGWQQISKRVSELKVFNKTVRKQFNFYQEDLSIWHKVLEKWRWRLQFSKQCDTKIEILTGNTPYNGQKLKLQIGKVFGMSTTKDTYLRVSRFELDFMHFTILFVPKLEITLEIKLRQTMIDIFLAVRMFQEIGSFRLSSQIIKQLQQQSQLQKDWLLIYGIYQKDVPKEAFQLQDIQSMTYLEIISLLAQKRSNQLNSNSLLNYLNHFQFKFYARQIQIGIIDQDLQLVLNARQFETFTLLQPDHDIYNQIKVRRSKITLESISLSFNKIYIYQNDFISQTRVVSQTKTKIGNIYQFIKCKRLVINFNWYFSEGKKMGLANRWIHADKITAQVSKRMQRYCNRMKNVLLFNKKVKTQTNNTQDHKPINKFRKAVLQIIQINRRRKILGGHIKKYNNVINLQDYELLLKAQEKVMILKGTQKALFFQRIQYGQADKYHSLPCQILTLTFPSCRIQLSGSLQSNHIEIMTAGKLTLQIEMSDQKIDEGKCHFQSIQIEITKQGKNILEDIIVFIVDLVNTSEMRIKRYNPDMMRYEQLMDHGREKLKEKIEWNQSDLKWKQRQIFCWNFVLKDLSVLISTAQSNILSLKIDKTEMILHIFDNQKIERRILFRNIQVINQLQPLDSQYRKILELGKENVGLAVIVNSYRVNAFTDVTWKYIKQLSFWVQPVKIRATEQLIKLLTNYLTSNRDQSEELTGYDEIREYRKKIPDYYKICTIEPISMQFWLRSSNIFKRMEGIKLKLDKYEMKEFFYTEKQLGRAIGFWLLKQMGYKIFSLLGQKLFGDFESVSTI